MYGKSVFPGDVIDSFPADLYNKSRDMAAAFDANQYSSRANGLTIYGSPRVVVYVHNNSGEDCAAGYVLGLEDSSPLVLDSTATLEQMRAAPILSGVEPDWPTHLGKFAVLLEQADADAVVPAVLGGYAVVKLDVVNNGHKYADVKDATYTKLETREFGGARIVKKESTGTGDKMALVQLGTLHLPDIHGQLTEDLDAGLDADFTVYEMQTDGSYSSTGRTATGWGNYIDSGKSILSTSRVWFRPQITSGLLELIQAKPCAS